MEQKILRIVLNRCDENPTSVASAASASDHTIKETCNPGLKIKREEPENFHLYPKIEQNYGNYSFTDELEALLKSEPEEYQPQPVTESLTFYSADDADVPKLSLKTTHDLSGEKCFDGFSKILSQGHCRNPMSSITCHMCEEAFTSRSILRHWMSVHELTQDECRLMCQEYSAPDEDENVVEKPPEPEFSVKVENFEDFFEQLEDPLAIEVNVHDHSRLIFAHEDNTPKLSTYVKVEKFEEEELLELEDPVAIDTPDVPVLDVKRKGVISRSRPPVRRPPKIKTSYKYQCPICEKPLAQGHEVHQHLQTVHHMSYGIRSDASEIKRKRRIRVPGRCPPKSTSTCPICEETFATVYIRKHWECVHKLYEELTSLMFVKYSQGRSPHENSKLSVIVQKLKEEWLESPKIPKLDIVKCKFCFAGLKNAVALRKHEISVHGYNRADHSQQGNGNGKNKSHVILKKRERGCVSRMKMIATKQCRPSGMKIKSTFLCPICDKFFAAKQNVQKHLRKIHGLPLRKCLEIPLQ